MTMAIDNDANVAADQAAATDLKRDAGRLTAGLEHNPGSGARIAAGQGSRRAWDRLGELDAAVGPLRVLIVEEDPEVGRLLAEILAEFGHVVCGVEVDGAAAAISARHGRVDLIMVDIGLGERRAIAAVEQILKERSVPHVVVIADTLRGLALPPDVALIQKPFHGSALMAAIAQTIETRNKAERPGAAQGNLTPAQRSADDRAKRLA